MRRLVCFAIAQMAILGAAWAQDGVSVRVSGAPCGRFYVDGQLYDNANTFLWAPGTWHTLTIGRTYNISDGTRCVVGSSWVNDTTNANLGTSNARIYVSGPASYSFAAVYNYRIALVLTGVAGEPPFSCGGTAYATVNGECVDSNRYIWEPAGTVMTVSVIPPAGYVFLGWGDINLPTTTTLNFTATAPKFLSATWRHAAHFTVNSEPSGMKVLVDRALVTTPVTLDWAPDSTHSLSPYSPQTVGSNTKEWVFDGWSDGGQENRTVTAPGAGKYGSLTVKYSYGSTCTFGTTPSGLSLSIDGRSNWHSYTFLWPVGSKHSISAPLEQLDAAGRKYVFTRWTIGGAATQDFTVTVGPHALANAVYEGQGQLLITSPVAKGQVLVDGVPCNTPCAVNRDPGVQATISAAASVTVDDAAHLQFLGWADGGPVERVWTATKAGETLVANFTASYRLTAQSDPAGGSKFTFSPASEDGFYRANSIVTVTAEPKSGYTFKNWDGQSILSPSLKLRMYEPRTVLANLATYPYADSVGNAAGETPETNVAPGSIISIRGVDLADTTANGAASPLAQSIAGVTATVNGRLLPLFSVSPAQVNAQLPSDFTEGSYTLTVHQSGKKDASVKFTVKRDAPGLFTETANDVTYALALHDDGKQVTPDNPAGRGETVTLLGTGFGPSKPAALDGFAVPATPATRLYPLVDTVEIRVGDKTVLQPASSQAAKGYIGTAALRVTIPSDAAGESFELRAAVKDPADKSGKTYHESNTVQIPLTK
jgi:uncharacterized protein (TIGR03437 family)